eukprot:m.220427 g.220427  ORF g.220427 m.220427 type:complete len:258 (+) comp15920_c0_seq23:186-959(+)
MEHHIDVGQAVLMSLVPKIADMLKAPRWTKSVNLDVESLLETAPSDESPDGNADASKAGKAIHPLFAKKDTAEAVDNLFTDKEFPPVISSLDGSLADVSSTRASLTPSCLCEGGKKARLRFVGKDGANQGRPFWGCALKRGEGCSFFQWARREMVPHSSRDLQVKWFRLRSKDGYTVVRKGFKPSDVLQGGVGDCWLMSAIAVVAERPDILDRIILDKVFYTKSCFKVILIMTDSKRLRKIQGSVIHRWKMDNCVGR